MDSNIKDRPRCPESKQHWYQRGFPARCNLNDKYCLLDTDGTCPTYDDYLFELKQEELDHKGRGEDWLRSKESQEKFNSILSSFGKKEADELGKT